MSIYSVRFYCRECFGEDDQGCFDGGYDDLCDDSTGARILFPTLEEAIAKVDNDEDISWNIDYHVFDESNGTIVFDSRI